MKNLFWLKSIQQITYFFIIGFIFYLITACHKNDKKSTYTILPDENNGGLTLPAGFSALIVADDLGNGRHIVVHETGDIYLSLNDMNNNGGIVAMRDTDGNGRADSIQYFGDYTGTGIEIHKGYLYFGSNFEIIRYPLVPGQLVPETNPQIIAKGFVRDPQHASKTFAFDSSGNMYVNVGAPSNACQQPDRTPGVPGVDPCPILEYAGGIWVFKDDGRNQEQLTEGERFATGLRNSVAITWNPNTKKIYVLQHGRDQLSQFYPDLYTQQQNAELPAEEFFEIEKGDDAGWPYCYYNPINNKKTLAPEYGGNADSVGRCEEKKKPLIGFPAHTAPNDIVFYTSTMFPEHYQNGAFIAFHGSWNRAPEKQEGFYVAFVPFKDGKVSGDWEIFANGFAGVDPVLSPADAQFRPCGLAMGPDGSLYVADSKKGRIWRIIYTG
ncbi:MAG: sorbosone dehydrogenase [Bacteroidales bacterium]|nr:sorbosone dehydrogenase [Bacteroidales bacterium]